MNVWMHLVTPDSHEFLNGDMFQARPQELISR